MIVIQKREISLRYWLLGKNYHAALAAMEFGAKYHCGFRKDGVTPEFDHQISIAHYVRTLPDLMFPEDCLTVTFLHDVREDFNVSDGEIRGTWGDRVADAVECMTKVFRGIKKIESQVFADIAQDPIASICKGGDRNHNFASMVGVFTLSRQKDYLAEGDDFFLANAEDGAEKFPSPRSRVREYQKRDARTDANDPSHSQGNGNEIA